MKKEFVFLLFLANQAWANPSSLVNEISDHQALQDSQSQLVVCLSNQDFKDDLTFELGRTIERIKEVNSTLVDDRFNEVCVNITQAQDQKLDTQKIEEVIDQKQSLTLEALKKFNEVEQPISESVVVIPQKRPATTKQKIIFTLRGAVAGAVGAAAGRVSRPVLDALSDKGHGENLSIGHGALIGAVVDILQRASGETNENKILAIDAGAALVGSMLKTKDPNVMGVAIVLTLSQVPAVQSAVEKLSQMTPKKLDWKIPAAMIGAFYLIGKNKKNEQWIPSNHVPAVATYGALAYGVAAAKENETTGFIIATTVSLLDEVCDKLTPKCKGRFSTTDLAANTLGAYIGVKLSTYLPPGLFLNFYKKGVAMSYQRSW